MAHKFRLVCLTAIIGLAQIFSNFRIGRKPIQCEKTPVLLPTLLRAIAKQ
jgi:hypothetical protein